MVHINKIIHIKYWLSILPVVKDTLLRFPLPIILTLLATLSSLMLLHDIGPFDDQSVIRFFASMTYGTIALTSLKLFSESKHWSTTRQIIVAIIIMMMIIYYVWTYPVALYSTTNIFFSLTILLSLLFAPYIKSTSTSDSVWYFNYQTGVAVFFAGLAALISGAGLSLSLASLDYLFNIDVEQKVYGDIWLFSWSILFPVYILANIAKVFDYEDESCNFPKGVSFIANYILAPLMLVYMAILYAYFFKIIIQWELPSGNLGWMITTFGTIGIITKLLAYPIRHSSTRLLVWFDRYYYYALIVPIFLLFIAIGVRIKDYGLTEHRYAVVLLGIWFTAITAIAVVKKNQFHIKTVPMLLAVLALFASFGPWSAIDLSLQSQLSRFNTLLEKHQLLHNGQVITAKQTVSFTDLKSMSSIADYLTQNKYRVERIKPMFTSLVEKSDKKTLIDRRYAGGKSILELMGLTYINRWQKEAMAGTAFNYTKQYRTNRYMTDVSNYDYISNDQLYLNKHRNNAEHTFELPSKSNPVNVYVTIKKEGLLTITIDNNDNKTKLNFNLIELVQRIKEQNITKINIDTLHAFTLTKKSKGGRFLVRLVIDQIGGKEDINKKLQISQLKYTLMLKLNDETLK